MKTTVRWVCVGVVVISAIFAVWDVQKLMEQGGELLQIAALISVSISIGIATAVGFTEE